MSKNFKLLVGIFQVPSHELMNLSHGEKVTGEILSLSPLGDACSRVDLTAIHEILEKLGYKDDEGTANEVLACLFLSF